MQWIRKQIYWIAGVMVGGLVLWLLASAVTIRSVKQESAGSLFGRPVPAADYLAALQAVTHQALLVHGDRFRQDVSIQEMEEQAWERLLFLREARRKGIRVSDREVVQELQASPLFRNSQGQFDPKGYRVVMQYTLGTTRRVFEEEIRENLIIQKLIQQAVGSPAIAEEEIKKRFQEREGAVQIQYAAFADAGLAREAADACRGEPQQMERLAKQAGAKVVEIGFFKREEPVPGLDSPRALFSQMAPLQPGEAAGPFKTRTGWAVARLKARKPPEEKDFDAARPALEKELLAQKRLKNYLAWYQELLTRAKPGKKKSA